MYIKSLIERNERGDKSTDGLYRQNTVIERVESRKFPSKT